MRDILIVDEDRDYQKQMAKVFIDAGYNVTLIDSVANAICEILKKTAQVVLLGTASDDMKVVDLIPIMKQCNKTLTIILVTANTPLGLLRKLRCEGIFYHALKPADTNDHEEIRQAVKCAFENLHLNPA